MELSCPRRDPQLRERPQRWGRVRRGPAFPVLYRPQKDPRARSEAGHPVAPHPGNGSGHSAHQLGEGMLSSARGSRVWGARRDGSPDPRGSGRRPVQNRCPSRWSRSPRHGHPGGQLRACRLGVGCVRPCPPPPRRKPAGLASEVLRESSAEPPLSACPNPGPRWAATAPPARKPRCREQPPVATQARLPRGPGLPTSTPCGPHAAARRSGRWVQVGASPHRHRPLAQRSCLQD